MSPDPRSFLPLNPLEFRILLVLFEGASHGYRIVKDIEARDGAAAAIYPANLYRRVRDLLDRGLIEDAPAPRGATDDGRRSYVRLTALGRAVARAEAQRLEALVADARAVRALGSGPA